MPQSILTNQKFDVKTSELLIWRGQVVMSRGEEPFLEKIFRRVAHLEHDEVLEVGFGLGVSAGLIQKHLRPKRHDIVEIDRSIHRDLLGFARSHSQVSGILGDFWYFKPKRRYDFIFFDPYSYEDDDNDDEYDSTADDLEWAKRIRRLLKPEGHVCVPTFGATGAGNVPGFTRTLHARLRVPPYLTEEGRTVRTGTFECWRPA